VEAYQKYIAKETGLEVHVSRREMNIFIHVLEKGTAIACYLKGFDQNISSFSG